MSRTEKAWESVDRSWHPHRTDPDTAPESLLRVRGLIRDLQGMRLPVTAIDNITALIRAVETYTLENSWCPECGIRADGTVECKRCKQRFDSEEVSISNGLCEECQQEDDDDSDGL